MRSGQIFLGGWESDLNTPETTRHKRNRTQCCPWGSRQHYKAKNSAMPSEHYVVTFRQYLFWTGYFFDNNRLLHMSCQHCSNLADIAQEKSRINIGQKGKIVRKICNMQRGLSYNNSNNNNNNNNPETRKYWVDGQRGRVSSHGVKDPL